MKYLLTLLILLQFSFSYGQSDNLKYNKALAEKLGADDYGMKMYVFVILKTGLVTADKIQTDILFRGHMQNIGHLADAGKLVVAGPMQKNDMNYRGIFILNVTGLEEAKLLLDTEPAIKANLLAAELFQWYGSAALPEYLKYHEMLEKKKI